MTNSGDCAAYVDKRGSAEYEIRMRDTRFSLAMILATWFGAGLAPWAPGTIGTIAGLPFIFIIKAMYGDIYHIGFTAAVCLAGWWAADRYAGGQGRSDPQEVVIDEVVGISITLLFAPLSWPSFLAGFALFRLFDISKPWPVGWADRKVKGGLGIMLDDILAGLMALAVMQTMIRLGVPL